MALERRSFSWLSWDTEHPKIKILWEKCYRNCIWSFFKRGWLLSRKSRSSGTLTTSSTGVFLDDHLQSRDRTYKCEAYIALLTLWGDPYYPCFWISRPLTTLFLAGCVGGSKWSGTGWLSLINGLIMLLQHMKSRCFADRFALVWGCSIIVSVILYTVDIHINIFFFKF